MHGAVRRRATVINRLQAYCERALARLDVLFGRGLVLVMSLVVLVALSASLAAFGFLASAAPSTLTIASGPQGSTFRRTAEEYKRILARDGVTLKILPSEGSLDNLAKLANPKVAVDVGFVLGGESDPSAVDKLMSLGSISYQPLMIFYRGPTRQLLSQFKGQRIDIGPLGSGANSLAKALLQANGIQPGDGTSFVDTDAQDTVRALEEGRIDAYFALSDSTPTTVIRELLHAPNVHLYDVTQADGYARRIQYLNKLQLPRGSIDFGQDIPAQDVQLVGPTVELLAREGLHPALSDLLLEAAREVHAKPGLFKKRGEFPAPLEHDYRISPDATRYYASGRGFLYRTFPFWVASLIARLAAALLPVVVLLIPAMRIVPALYRWRATSRIYRWYGALQRLERDALRPGLVEEQRLALVHHLDQIESAVTKIIVPAAYGDLLYGLRGHIGCVRETLRVPPPVPPAAAVPSVTSNSAQPWPN